MTRLAIGSYTEAPATGAGVTLVDFDPATAGMTQRAVISGLVNPSWLLHAGRHLYAACEAEPARAALATLALDPPALLHVAPIAGDLPCHLAATDTAIAVACYGSGSIAVHAIDPTGLAGDQTAAAAHHGHGPHPGRQTAPHSVCFAPQTADPRRWLLVPDLGTDQVWIHRLDPATGRLAPDPARWQAPAGSGPRHIAFHPDGRFAVLVTELSREVIALAWSGGRLAEVARLALPPPGTAAALRWHPGGQRLAVTIRGSDTAALIGFDPETGRLTLLDHQPCGGKKPRDCRFSPCGRWLLVANQDSDNVAVLALDAAHRRLADSGQRFATGAPACLEFC